MHSSKGARLHLVASLIFILILFIPFIQLAGANDGNLSISGTKFLDMDANGVKAANEPGLAGYAIYWDKNNNTKWDSDEDRVLTDENGNYTYNKLSNNTYIIRELILGGDNLLPSFPQYGYYSINLTDKNVTGKDFGSTVPSPVNETTILIILGLFAAFFIAAGFLALFKCFSEMKSLEGKQNSDKKTKIQIIQIQLAAGFILLILGLFLLITLLQYSRDITGRGAILANYSSSLVIPGVITILIFIAVLAMLYTQTKLRQMDDTNGMRKTISGLLVVGLIVVVLFALSGTINDNNQNIITQFIQLVGVVIAFYFGSRATESAYKDAQEKADEGDAEKDLDIKDVIFKKSPDGRNKTITVVISNSKKRNFKLKKVSINKENTILFTHTFEPEEEVKETHNPYTTHDLKVEEDEMKDFNANTNYNISIETSIGKKEVTRKITGPISEEKANAERDLDIIDVIFKKNADGSTKTITVVISNSKKRNFTLNKVSINKGNENLFTDEPGEEIKDNPHTTDLEFKGDDFDKTTEYDIIIETSIGKKEVTRKITVPES